MIKKRNLDNSLIQWLMTVTNLGPGIGEIKYVAPAASSTSQFRTRLQQDGVDESDLFTTLLAAETALTAYRNDIVLAFPGKYTQILEHAWDKAHTHLIGLGGPVQGHYRTSTLSDMRNVLFHTITATNPSVINVTGENCQFHNFQAHNEGDNSANVAAVIADKFGCYFKGVNFRGATSTTGKDNVNCGSLQIDGAAHYNTFVDCWIGHNTYSAGVRAVEYAGHLVISEGYSQNLHFQHCRFLLRSETANCGLVRFAQSVSADRQWLFEDYALPLYNLQNFHKYLLARVMS